MNPAYIMGGIQLISGMMGQAQASGDSAKSRELMQRAMDEWNRIKPPTLEEQRLLLEELKSQGHLTPEMEQAITQNDTELNKINEDPRLRQAQMSALSKLQEIGDGGMMLTDKADLAKIQQATAQQEKSQRDAILQNMAARGMGGSGIELAAQLNNVQGAANRNSQAGLDIAAQAQQRALNALMQAGQMGGEIRNQDYSIARDKASAQDVINKFNTSMQADVNQRNTATRNNSQQYNLENTQRIADTNVGLRNQAQINNKNLYQQDFQNQATIAAGKTGQLNNMSNNYLNSAANTQAMWGGIGEGISKGYLAGETYDLEKKKYNIQD